MAQERIQKIVARAGLASRRGAEEMISCGRVRLNGKIVTELGTQADPKNDVIEVDGRRIVSERPVYVLLHKPRGVVSTRSDPEGRPTVVELVSSLKATLYPVGRLDFHTSGALLLTNDGDFTQGLLHPKKKVPKVYAVKVQGEMTEKDLNRWREGVKLENGTITAPCEVFLLRHEGGKTWMEVTLHEGRNQQIRRMGEATGFPVMRLARLSFAGISTEGLRPGQFRPLTPDELRDIKASYGVPRRIPRGEPALEERPPTRSHKKSSAAVPSARVQADSGTRSRPPSRSKRPR
jgi:23S rRNA pseudouridine2605 synthase